MSSSARSGHNALHISRATSPWRRLTALATRLVLRAACVTPNSSPSSSGLVRPSAIRSSTGIPTADASGDLGLADRDRYGQRRPVAAGDERGRDALGIGIDPVLVLHAAGIDALAEVAAAVHQPDGDQRHGPVRGLFEQIARQHAEAA